MTYDEAIAARREMMQRARLMAWYAGRPELPWGHRYEAIVLRDECLEKAEDCERIIRYFAGVS